MLEHSNIQGNILRGYASFPDAGFLFLQVHDAGDGRALLQHLLDNGFVTPGRWQAKPEATLNIAVSFAGLRALGLPQESLASFPAEFQEGMRHRADALGDTDKSAPEHWDEPWKSSRVDIMLMIYGHDDRAVEAHCQRIRNLLPNGVQELKPGQSAGRLRIGNRISMKEHFGFLDGLSNPSIEGVPDEGPRGRRQDIGNPDGKGGFRHIPLGEFLLGYPGEGGELAPMPVPHALAHDGTYLVLRKLEQDVPAFRRYLDQQTEAFARTLPESQRKAAQDYLRAKLMGRWPNGSSLIDHPHAPPELPPKEIPANMFGYAADPTGARCPLGAHVRRVNPRDSLGFDGKTMSRHRLIRRGIAYGRYLPEPENGQQTEDDHERRGILFIALNSGFDQFEFVQQKWVNFGDDFQQGNDTDPITGTGGQMVIPGDEATGRRPFICFDMPRFVYTRGGDYFFVPSLTALSLVASGGVYV